MLVAIINGSECRAVFCNRRFRNEKVAPAADEEATRLRESKEILLDRSANEERLLDAIAFALRRPVSAASLFAFASSSARCSCLALSNSSFASARISSSSSRSFKSSGRPYLPLTASSASFLILSIFFSVRNLLRTRLESVYGSLL